MAAGEPRVAPRASPSIDVPLVSRLVAAQFPQWAYLPITPVRLSGWDNRTLRLGEDMTVRLPSDEAYTPQVDKEHRWLPILAPQLPLPVPVPLAKGVPTEGLSLQLVGLSMGPRRERKP